MKSLLIITLISAVCFGLLSCSKQAEPVKETPATNTSNTNTPASIYDFKMKDIDGKEVSLSEYKGKVVVMVNVASECGYTGQYEGIQKFYLENKDKGVVVLGFPANNFGGQEPGTELEIKQFCTGKYNVSFPMFSKISVKGDDIHPLYKFVTTTLKQDVSWNFNKVLVGKDGKPVKMFKSGVKVSDKDFTEELSKLLK